MSYARPLYYSDLNNVGIGATGPTGPSAILPNTIIEAPKGITGATGSFTYLYVTNEAIFLQDISVNTLKIGSGLANYNSYNPGSYTDSTLVPKEYVDQFVSGITIESPVIAIQNNSPIGGTYSGSGVGSITGVTSPLIIDGVTIQDGSAVLLNSQSNSIQNGVYTWSSGTTTLTRRTGMQNGNSAKSVYTLVKQGTNYGKTSWVQINNPAIVGTNNLNFIQFSTFDYRLGRGLDIVNTGGNSIINVDTSLNFVNFLDSNTSISGANGTLALGTATSNSIILGPTGGMPIQVQSTIQAQQGITGGTGSFSYGRFYTNLGAGDQTLIVSDLNSGGTIKMLPNSGNSTFNPSSQLNNQIIVARGNTINSGTLELTTWSSTNSAVKIYPTSVTIGAGGTGATPTTSVVCDGSNVIVTGQIIAQSGITGATGSFNNLYVTNKATFLTDISVNSINIGLGGGGVNRNIAIGYQALQSNMGPTGTQNIAIGYQVLQSNTTASNNIGIGTQTLQANTTGFQNIGIGSATLQYNTTGNENTAIGHISLASLTSGNSNVGLGYKTLYGVTGGSENTAIGAWSAWSNTTGSNNTFLGAYSGFDISYNTYNNSTAIGAYSQITASNQMMLGGNNGFGVYPQVVAPGGITGPTGSFQILKVGTGGDFGVSNTCLDVSGNILLVNSIDNTSVNQFGYSLGVISTSAPNVTGIVNSSIAVLSQGYETAFIASRGNTFDAGSNPKNFFAIYQDALNNGNYNPITKQNDHVLLTGEYGRNPGIQDASGGIVICPWSATASGARMDVSGNFTFYNPINAPAGITGTSGSFNSLTSNNINTTGAVNIGDTLTTNNVVINGTLGVTGQTFLTNTFEVFTNSTNSYQGAFLYKPTGSAINQNEGTLFSANGIITEIKMNNIGPANFTISNDGSFNIIDTSTSTNSYTTGQNLLCIKSNANGGNVGINTTNPSSKLDINGTLNASGNTTLSTLTTTGLSTLNSLNVGTASQTTIDTNGNIVANYLTLNGNSSTWTSNSAVTKAYVDVLSSGINLKAACQCATTTSISGFPNSVGTSLQIDTYNVQNNDRVLVKDQGSSVDNGIYVYNNSGSGSLSRSSDMLNNSSATNLVTFVQNGSANARTSFLQTAPSATVGITGLTFVQQNTIDFELGYGLTLSGSTISVNSNLFNTTSVGTLTSLTVSPGATSLSTLTTSGLATLNSASVTNSLTTNTATINSTLNVTGATTLSSTLAVGNNMSFTNFTGTGQRSITFSGNSDTALLNFVSTGDSGTYFQIGTTDNTLTQDEPIFFTQNNYLSPLATYARMRINNAGVYINPDMTSDPYGTGFTNVASSSYQLNVNGSGTFVGSVTTSATFNTSDYRIKENVEILNDSYSVDNLRPVTYLNKKTDKQDIGLIAHEVQEYIPILVNGEKDGEDMQTINYIGLIGILIKEVKDLKERVKALEEK